MVGSLQVLEGTRFFSLQLQVKGDLQSIARTIVAAGCLPLLVRIIGNDSSPCDARDQVCAADSCFMRTIHLLAIVLFARAGCFLSALDR